MTGTINSNAIFSYEDEAEIHIARVKPKEQIRPVLINFYAGPGAGKSTCAAALFAVMKEFGYNVELVTEYAKDITWEGRTSVQQAKIIGEQQDRLNKLIGKVEFIITDGPLLHGIVYAKDMQKEKKITNGLLASYESLVLELYKGFMNIDIFIRRSDTRKYRTEGRTQTEVQARKKDEEIKAALIDAIYGENPIEEEIFLREYVNNTSLLEFNYSELIYTLLQGTVINKRDFINQIMECNSRANQSFPS